MRHHKSIAYAIRTAKGYFATQGGTYWFQEEPIGRALYATEDHARDVGEGHHSAIGTKPEEGYTLETVCYARGGGDSVTLLELIDNLDGYGIVITDQSLMEERLEEIQDFLHQEGYDSDHSAVCVNEYEGINPEAVPDLLAACKALYSAETFSLNEGVTLDDHMRRDARMETLRAAIAKAEGGDSVTTYRRIRRWLNSHLRLTRTCCDTTVSVVDNCPCCGGGGQ